MKHDLEMIVNQFDKDVTIYPISDVHLGALEYNSSEWEKFINKINNEPNSYLILNGDLMNNATRSSVSNVFDDVLRPREQKTRLIEYLLPIKDKILCAVSGNHERRSGKDADNDPMYDIMCKLDLEDVYRQNTAFLKIQLGSPREIAKRQGITYTIVVTHGTGGGIYTGATVNRNERFGYTIDNLDCLIVGHTHKGTVSKPSKIVIDARNNVVSLKEFTVISTQSWLSYGGYAMQKMLLPSSNATADNGQRITLFKNKKAINVNW